MIDDQEGVEAYLEGVKTEDEMHVELFTPSNLQRIAQFNEKAGVYRERRELGDEAVKAQWSFLKEELKELSDALRDKDRKEVVDALADIVVVTVGAMHRLGYDPDQVMDIVNASNESKFISIYDYFAVQSTLDKYQDDARYKNVVVNTNGAVWGIVVETGKRKILKGTHYQDPQWVRMDPELK